MIPNDMVTTDFGLTQSSMTVNLGSDYPDGDMVLLSPATHTLEEYLNQRHNSFLLHPFLFIIHNHLSTSCFLTHTVQKAFKELNNCHHICRAAM
jgi:hypothetical protein